MHTIQGMKLAVGIAALLLATSSDAVAENQDWNNRGWNNHNWHDWHRWYDWHNHDWNHHPGGKPVAVPEIDAGHAGTAVALLIGGILLASERARSSRPL